MGSTNGAQWREKEGRKGVVLGEELEGEVGVLHDHVSLLNFQE